MAVTNYGIVLQKGSTDVGEITNLSFPTVSTPAVETTNHSSAGVRTFISRGLTELGEFTITINATQTEMDILEVDRRAGTVDAYTIVYTTVTGGLDDWDFSALVTEIAMQDSDAMSPDTLSLDVTFRPSGDLTMTAVPI